MEHDEIVTPEGTRRERRYETAADYFEAMRHRPTPETTADGSSSAAKTDVAAFISMAKARGFYEKR